MTRHLALLSLFTCLLGCGRVGYPTTSTTDSGTSDSATPDSGTLDARAVDGGPAPDASLPDLGAPGDAGPLPTEGLTVSCGEGHTCALRGSSLFCWGDNSGRAIGNGDAPVALSPVAIAPARAFAVVRAGDDVTCAITTSRELYCWGRNVDGALGQGDTTTRNVPTRVGVRSDWARLDVRYATVLAIPVDGTLWGWGLNTEGQLGLDDPSGVEGVNRLAPEQLDAQTGWTAVFTGQGHTFALRGTAAFGAGRNSSSELGLGPGADIQFRTRQSVGAWASLAPGQNHSCGIDPSGALYCWGENSPDGRIALPAGPTDAPVRVGSGNDWTHIATGTFHTCGIRRPGTLWCFGRGAEGMLGTGDGNDRTTPTRIGTDSDWTGISVGRFHTCGVRGNTVYCAGDGSGGAVGRGNTDRQYTFVRVTLP